MGPGKPHRESIPENQVKWRRSQDHLKLFSTLIRWELDDEMQLMQERWKTWTNKRLAAAGLTLFNLNGRMSGRFFGDPVVAFSSDSEDGLPWHGFSHGDIVILSRSSPTEKDAMEGTVLDRNRKRIRLVLNDKPDAIERP